MMEEETLPAVARKLTQNCDSITVGELKQLEFTKKPVDQWQVWQVETLIRMYRQHFGTKIRGT